jgi:hypothetical protein
MLWKHIELMLKNNELTSFTTRYDCKKKACIYYIYASLTLSRVHAREETAAGKLNMHNLDDFSPLTKLLLLLLLLLLAVKFSFLFLKKKLLTHTQSCRWNEKKNKAL